MKPAWRYRLRAAWRALRGLPPYCHAFIDHTGSTLHTDRVSMVEDVVVVRFLPPTYLEVGE